MVCDHFEPWRPDFFDDSSTTGLKAIKHLVNLTSMQANVLSELTYFQILKHEDQFREMFEP